MHEIILSESKSFANRVLIISSFQNEKQPEFNSRADDIVELNRALKLLKEGQKEFTIGEGGTTFRFLLTRLSREIGSFRINAKPQLLKRPQKELYDLLGLLGAKVNAQESFVEIESNGWNQIQEINIDCSKSTQFASAIILCAFNLKFDLKVNFLNFDKSITYLEMTKTILINAGMNIEETERGITIRKNGLVKKLPIAEPDMSSAFSIASMGVIGPDRVLKNIPINSIQGDSVFMDILKRMNVKLDRKDNSDGSFDLYIYKSVDSLKPINVDLSQCPDLLPVLSSLCALANGTSRITGIGHTRFKESDRIEKSQELVIKAGAKANSKQAEIEITGPLSKCKSFSFDPDNDHRMAMAAAVLKVHGVPVTILHPEVVNKSYPNFWEDAGV